MGSSYITSHVQASVAVKLLQLNLRGGLFWSCVSTGLLRLAQRSAEPPSSSSFMVDGYCLIMNPAGSLHACHYPLREAIQRVPAGHILSYVTLPSPAPCASRNISSGWFGAYNIPTDVDPSVFTSRARPCGVVSNMAPGRPALHLAFISQTPLGRSSAAENNWEY